MATDDTTAVNLSSQNLCKTPEEFLQECDHIRSLDLSRNKHILLRNSIHVFKCVRKVNLSDCNLTEAPAALSELTELEELDLSDNDFSQGLSAAVGHLIRLKKLLLRNCKMVAIPDCIGDLVQLEELILSNAIHWKWWRSYSVKRIFGKTYSRNDFSTGTKNVLGRLSRLRKLDLKACSLRHVPDCIVNLTKLEELDLSGNEFSNGVSAVLGGLLALKKLYLSDCKMETFPDCIGDLVQLEELNLSRNAFSNGVSAVLGGLVALKKLYLSNCEMQTFPDCIGDLVQLEELDLSGNKFSNGVRAVLGRLLALKELKLRSCVMVTFPDGFGDLVQLEELDISHNAFSKGVSAALGRLVALKKLNLMYCKMETFPDCIGDLVKLEELKLSHNAFSNGGSAVLGRLVALKKLDLSFCKMETFPDCIGDLVQLEVLNLSDNKLRDYPRCTLKMTKLKTLDLSSWSRSEEGNAIRSLPTELAYTNLDDLNLAGNPISDPPQDIWEQGLQAIKSYMRAIIPGGRLMYSDTLNMIGDTEAGKSSVAQSLVSGSPQPTEKADRTRVLQQLQMIVDESLGHAVNINDFGGHEIYHSVMPIFLPSKGVVLLVVDLTSPTQKEQIRKWLLTVIAKSKEIRVIIVGTHADQIGKKRMQSEEEIFHLQKTIVEEAIDEVNRHIADLTCRFRNNATQRKLNTLEQLRGIMQKVNIPIVTVSCSLPGKGLTKLRNLIVDYLRPPAILPIRWCRVIEEIRHYDSACLYMTMEQVLDVGGKHFTDDDSSEALPIILRYLSETSQIIWLEELPELRDFVFHSPQKIVDACRKIFFHNSEALFNCHTIDIREQYEKGLLAEPVLLELLGDYTAGVYTGNTTALRESTVYTNVVKFMEAFNLISYVETEIGGKQFVIPCKLSPDAPQKKLRKLEQRGVKCLNRVIVRLSFIGSLIPMSLFETMMSLIMSVAANLTTKHVVNDIWRDGIIIQHNGVYFIAKRRDSVIILRAFSGTHNASPWAVLRPILNRLNECVTESWHGAPPDCVVVCPICSRRVEPSDCDYFGKGVIRTHLEELASNNADISSNCEEAVADDYIPWCKECSEFIPRILCFPPKNTEYSLNYNDEIQRFFQSVVGYPWELQAFEGAGVSESAGLEAPRRRKPSDNDEYSSKRCGIADQGSSQSLTIADKVVCENFRLAGDHIASSLSQAEVSQILSKLWSSPSVWITVADKEQVESVRGATRKATELLDMLQKKGPHYIREFQKILRKINRKDLADFLDAPNDGGH